MSYQVDIYMTVKNGMPFILESINSVLKQTYNNWKMTIVDDGSTDGTVGYLLDLAEKDDRFSVITTDGVGRAVALNIALANLKGDLVANLDADDTYHPKKLEYQVDAFKEYPGIDFLCCESFAFKNQIEYVPYHEVSLFLKDLEIPMRIKNRVCHSSVLFKRSLIQLVGKYNEERKTQIDLELWYRMLMHNIRLYQLPLLLTGKRVHSRQSFENKKRIRYLWNSYLLRKWYLKSCNLGVKFHLLSLIVLFGGFLPYKIRSRVNRTIR